MYIMCLGNPYIQFTKNKKIGVFSFDNSIIAYIYLRFIMKGGKVKTLA